MARRIVPVLMAALLGPVAGWAQEGGRQEATAERWKQLEAILEAAAEQAPEQTPYDVQVGLLEHAAIQMENVAGEDWVEYMRAARHYDTLESIFRTEYPVEFASFKVAARSHNFMVLHQIILEVWLGKRPRPDGEPCAVTAPCREEPE